MYRMLYLLTLLTLAREVQQHKLPEEVIGPVPEISERKRTQSDKASSRHHHGSRRRDRLRKKDREEEVHGNDGNHGIHGNEIDLNHADFEDTELVADLNKNVIFDSGRNGVQIVQGDMLTDPNERKRVTRGAVRPNRKLWPGGVIYYDFTQDLGQLKIQLVLSAMNHITDQTCIQFRRRLNNEPDYLNITSVKGCYSWVGRRGGSQEVSVGSGCVTRGIIAHELAHAIGFYHEQSRPDRDNYVELLKENVKPTELDNFRKRDPSEVDSMNSPYDYGSLMHYGLKDFSGNKQPTLRTLRPVPKGVHIGQRVKLSDQDIKQANRLYNCPDKDPTPDEQEYSLRPNRHVGLMNSIMIVGGTQDTTEPLCLDGMTYQGNQVLVTLCGLSKSSQKWSWTDSYQLQNEGLTLCLSVEDGVPLGQPGDVPIRMAVCDVEDDRQKWVCNGGTLQNIALNKCVNAAWTPYKRNYMIAVSECNIDDMKQVLSVYSKGTRYEPVCHGWSIAGPKPDCHQEFTKSKTYLGCSKQRKNFAMIGFEKRGKRNNLKAIRAIDCCQLVNATGSIRKTVIRTIVSPGVSECPDGYFVQGLNLYSVKQRNLKALAYLHCIKPSEQLRYQNCYWDQLRTADYQRGLNSCSRGGFFLAGLQKRSCKRLNCITSIKCCSVRHATTNYTR